MKHPAKTGSTAPHLRATHLQSIIAKLNAWAMTPDSGNRTLELRDALREYQQAVKSKRYPPVSANVCNRTAASNTTPAVRPGSFDDHFSEHAQAPAAAPHKPLAKLAWED